MPAKNFLCAIMGMFLLLGRNERDTAFAMVKHKLTKEPDVFLGEKVIEVRRVGAPRDVWYKLGEYDISMCIYIYLYHKVLEYFVYRDDHGPLAS